MYDMYQQIFVLYVFHYAVFMHVTKIKFIEAHRIGNFYDETIDLGECRSLFDNINTYSSRSSSDNDGDAPQNADIIDEVISSAESKLKDNKRDKLIHKL